ncbi:MAG: hypothetical protein B6D37_03280 [Sphingobacteriales bacterium UTBCD1]|jgi:hypothetical protein|nr:MAG: hypothetical protein B6D37_03280 [Sphingobacteriales bacterium UTBCD1]
MVFIGSSIVIFLIQVTITEINITNDPPRIAKVNKISCLAEFLNQRKSAPEYHEIADPIRIKTYMRDNPKIDRDP